MMSCHYYPKSDERCCLIGTQWTCTRGVVEEETTTFVPAVAEVPELTIGLWIVIFGLFGLFSMLCTCLCIARKLYLYGLTQSDSENPRALQAPEMLVKDSEVQNPSLSDSEYESARSEPEY
jgi:hypothetical protein